MSDTSLFDGMFGRGGAAQEVSGGSWLRALLDAEIALARACATAGLIGAATAERVATACDNMASYDVASLAAAATSAGNPVVPLVGELRRQLGGDAAAAHLGATSQDILDTAMMLVARRASTQVCADARAAATAAAGLAARFRGTPMIGRTLTQQAEPTTFGLRAATWAAGLDTAVAALDAVIATLPAQLAGAAGTSAGWGEQSDAVLAAYAELLSLCVPAAPWHAVRLPVVYVGAALAALAGIAGKVATDVVLLAQSEVAEVREGVPGRGGSSSMPHKDNPVAAITVRAHAQRTPALLATLFAAMPQELERGAGGWQAEWETLSDLLRVTGSAVAWLRDCLDQLCVDADRMRTNLTDARLDPAALGAARRATDRILASRPGTAS